MMKCGVFFEVRTEFLNIIYTSFVFKGLTEIINKDIKTRIMKVHFENKENRKRNNGKQNTKVEGSEMETREQVF
jgi:hypothetical protein